MNTENLVSGLVGFVIGVLLTSVLTPMGGNMMGNKNSVTDGGDMSSRQSGMMGSIDAHFIEQMIPHHEGAVAMATLALQKSTHGEVKTLARAIIESQTKEINDMSAWYKNWFGKDVPKESMGMMGGGMMSGSGMHMGGKEDMTALETATDFDKAFLEAMIPHHQMALMMVRMLEAGTSRPEMIQLAKNISASQSKEIQDMLEWHQAWYGK